MAVTVICTVCTSWEQYYVYKITFIHLCAFVGSISTSN